jgi:L-lactate permease
MIMMINKNHNKNNNKNSNSNNNNRNNNHTNNNSNDCVRPGPWSAFVYVSIIVLISYCHVFTCMLTMCFSYLFLTENRQPKHRKHADPH